MKRAVVLLVVLALCAAPALAGQNPDIALYLYSTSTGVGGTNTKASPAPGSNTSVYVCFDNVWGQVYGASWKFTEVPGPDYLSVTNQYAGVGGLTIGDPGQGFGCAMTTGSLPATPTNGIIVLARVRYETPEPGAPRGGSITVIPHDTDGRAVADGNNQLDSWCVHSIAFDGLAGNFGWDDTVPSDGDCAIVPVEAQTWGSIKAMYR
jgi:hypothetical protein